MKWYKQVRPIDIMVLVAIAGYVGYKGASRPQRMEQQQQDVFAVAVDLEPLGQIAVQADGRLRSFESHARTFMSLVSGPRSIDGQSDGFTYLDLMFRPERYVDREIVYIKNKQVREDVLKAATNSGVISDDDVARITKRGLVSKMLLNQPAVGALIQKLGEDLIRSAKQVDAIRSAMHVSDPRFLSEELRLMAPPDGATDKPWYTMGRLVQSSGAPKDNIHSGLGKPAPIDGLDAAAQQELVSEWSALRRAWRDERADDVNTQIAGLASSIIKIAGDDYPSVDRLSLESWYFRNHSMTWVWLIYLAAVVPLLMSVIYKWDGARKVGLVLFIVAFGFHTSTLIIRWYISGRWPNSNMFEAVTTSAWFGGVGALILEWVTRRTPLRNVFALGSAVMSMAALMAAYFLPTELSSGIGNKMAALNDVWLYIHTNMIIWSYGIIGLACIPALLQLRHRWCLAWDERSIPKLRLFILPIAMVVANYTGYRLLMHALDDPARALTGNTLLGMAGAFWGSLMVLILEWVSASERGASGSRSERGSSGGASSLILGRGGGASFLTAERPTVSQVYDGATMVLVELSFIMLWTGIIMGAIWADHSWGRPWGWDPKEVFALNTFLIFLVLIHVRLKVKDRALWTSIIAVLGFEVMMFNWIVVNFVITGLHSYA